MCELPTELSGCKKNSWMNEKKYTSRFKMVKMAHRQRTMALPSELGNLHASANHFKCKLFMPEPPIRFKMMPIEHGIHPYAFVCCASIASRTFACLNFARNSWKSLAQSIDSFNLKKKKPKWKIRFCEKPHRSMVGGRCAVRGAVKLTSRV